MYTKNRRKTHPENIEITAGERDTGEEDDDETKRHYQKRHNKTSKSIQNKLANESSTKNNGASSLSNLSLPINNDKSAGYVAHLLHEADLTSLVQLDTINQIKYFLDERAHLISQIEFIRTQYEKQYTTLKRRLDETESENERLTEQYRSSSKELILYKNLIDAPENPESPTKSKDYQQLKLTIDKVLQENKLLHAELNHFKTSDPVYEQVQLLETSNKNLKEELTKSTNENNRLRKTINSDETTHLKANFKKILEEYEKIKLVNKNLLQQCQQQTSSPKQEHFYPSPPSPLSNQQQLSPISHRSSKSIDENLLNRYPSNEVTQLREHVQRLEQTLHKRDYELQKLQNEIDKGTSSIMSSIEDLYTVSTNVASPKSILKHQPTVIQLQNELDQLHDKLDELIKENQELKTRTQEFDTIYEENEYLYAEKSQWNEEMERARLRQLVLEQEVHTLREREKEFILTNDPTVTEDNSSASQLKLKINWLNQINNQLELEIVRLREQIELITNKFQQAKRDLTNKTQHYKQIIEAAQDAKKLPQELARVEKLCADMESKFEHERQEYEKTVAALEEQSGKREKKYSSLYDGILKLQNDYRQKELDFTQQLEDAVNQRDALLMQLSSFQNVCQQLQKENRSLEEEINSKNETNRDLKFALTSTTDDTQAIYSQLHQLHKSLSELQKKYDYDIAERNSQIEFLRNEQKKMMSNYDGELFKAHQTIIQLQHDNNQFTSQLERYRTNIDKLKTEINEKINFIEQLQSDLNERSALHLTINNQLTQENKAKMAKINELEQALLQEQQHKTELQRTVQELQSELVKSRILAKDSLEKSEEFERRFHETDKHFFHLNETTEPTKREINTLRFELLTRSDQNTVLQNTIEDEKLKRQRLEMKLKRLKDEYASIRKELYTRIEENNSLQQELIEYRLKLDYYAQINNQTLLSILPANENDQSTAVQLYLKEKADSQNWQFKCRMYQQKIEQVQRNYESTRDKYKQRLQEERDMFERSKIKYLEHMKNIQKDLHETRQLLEKDTELKMSQESAYQQLVDERRQLLTSMLDKDAKAREMRRENHLLISKIQFLENQMEILNDRVDRTLRERSPYRLDVNSLRLDSNVSIETSARGSPVSPTTRKSTTYIDSPGWNQSVLYTESFGFNNDLHSETPAVT
ncbi:unnamed protein product [Rotaria magnacalcarata]|uniref:Uncharacterized protein n=1 Tax=Rotaria magnacalcarata TaxID=392030 RepID=A0A816R9F1_9BILA|nr:unnamed protein product [Rotaria magnacalcarata]